MKGNRVLLLVVVVLLGAIDLLTFHDIFEPHTVKDWMILATSILACIYFAKVSLVRTK